MKEGNQLFSLSINSQNEFMYEFQVDLYCEDFSLSIKS